MIHEGETLSESSFVMFGIGSIVRSQQSSTFNALETVTLALKAAIDGFFPSLDHIHGYWAEFFFPGEEEIPTHEDVYGNYAPNHGYSDTPTISRRVVATGINVERMFSFGEQLDGYFGPPPVIWMNGDVVIPNDARVKVYLRERHFLEFKVDRTDTYYGLDKPLLNRLVLQPIATIA